MNYMRIIVLALLLAVITTVQIPLVGAQADPCANPTKTGQRIFGTDGPDVMKGTSGNDEIFGKGGDDIICGLDGHDYLHGGDGDDEI